MGKRNKHKNKQNTGETKTDTTKGAIASNSTQESKNAQAKTDNQKNCPNNKDSGTKNKTGSNGKGRETSERRTNKPVNDPSWYNLSDAITNQVASIPWSMFVGRTYDVYNREVAQPGPNATLTAVNPGVILFNYLPWYGDASAPSSALRISTRAFFQYVRHQNAGRTNYEAADLMIYIMAMDNIYLAIAECKRLLRLANTFAFNNRNMSKVILKAMCIDADDLAENYANYLARLNIAISKVNTMAVPNSFKLFLRRQAMALSVFSDDGVNPTQLIIPQSVAWFQFNFVDTAHSQSSSLTPIYKPQFTPTDQKVPEDFVTLRLSKFSDYLSSLEVMLNRVLDDEDMNIMSGDIMKAYGSEGLYHINLMTNTEVQEVVYDELFINQFRNADTLDLGQCRFITKGTAAKPVLYFSSPKDFSDSSTDTEPFIGQYNGQVSCRIVIDRSMNAPEAVSERCGPSTLPIYKDKIISWDRQLSPAETIEATRLTLSYDQTGEASVYAVNAGTEVGIGWQVVDHATYTMVEDHVVISQWFQRGRSNYSASPIPPDAATKGDVTFYAYVTTGGNLNTEFAHATMISMNASPFFTVIRSMGTALKPNVIPSMYGGRSFTAMVALTVVKSMTDAAISALLYSSFVKA